MVSGTELTFFQSQVGLGPCLRDFESGLGYQEVVKLALKTTKFACAFCKWCSTMGMHERLKKFTLSSKPL